ncbi:VOC family protein [Croceibacterium sp. LX-88]|uniref:VOC family protein n=1 Tax=Croceibacterium selenioxidans TaxID=2838833 RepID=A0ABS5W5V1_9SPHN|nr:VOC family protein [Croceibacterium selenioxidans]MBT2135143.1 VOC family protein [Croceibacterium selenioxidans]
MENENQGPASGVAAHLTIRDGRGTEAVKFYEQAFGAKEHMHHMADDGKRLMHSHLSINGGSLMLNDDFPEYRDGGDVRPPAGITLHLQVPDADAAWQRAVDAGAKVVFPLEDQFWGDRYGQVEDPFGFTWSIGGPKKE